jgi:transaldolase
MQDRGLLERLQDSGSGMEIWWDAFPGVFTGWKEETLAAAPAWGRLQLRSRLSRMFMPNVPMEQLVKGVTTNPRLLDIALQSSPSYWNDALADLIVSTRAADRLAATKVLYQQLVFEASESLMPLFRASCGRFGYVCAQLDPRLAFNYENMLDQALTLSRVNRNIMIKVPGTSAGYAVIERLTAAGVSTNNTLCFSLPQALRCAEAVESGLQSARSNGVDLEAWRSVITVMMARFSELGGLAASATEVGVTLSELDLRWAEVALFKKTYNLLKAHGVASKLLASSLRTGPVVGERKRIFHLEELAGADVVVTCPPAFVKSIEDSQLHDEIDLDAHAIERAVPDEVMDKLSRIPYFRRACSVDGYTEAQFDSHPALIATLGEFSEAMRRIDDFAGNVWRAAS